MESSDGLDIPQRKVGFLLGLGIFFVPIVFVWFLLRPGHAVISRIIGFVWAGLVVIAMVAGNNTAKPPARRTAISLDDIEVPQVSEEEYVWEYSDQRDEMRGTVTKYASLESVNELEFDFPYNGGSRGHLVLRKSPEHGLNVMLRMDKGQFTRTSDYVSVKFDDHPVVRFSTSPPADGRTEVLFISPEANFVTRLRKANKVIIEATFFQEGLRQLTFDTKGLDPAW